MTLTPVKIPLVAKKMFPNYIWDIPSTNKTIYLSFDDGPTPNITHWTLQTLKDFEAKATFFCIGNNIEAHPKIFQAILNDGHTIGNHTYDHLKGWKTPTKDYLKNVADTNGIINTLNPNKSKPSITSLFRPPYGQIRPRQGKQLLQLGYKIIMWDVLSFDWDATVSKETCLYNVISNTHDGSIIVFHDSLKASQNMQYALPKVLDHFSKQGYRFSAIEV